jgi:ubiquinone/menaquinone biosynthesis C-methylase UbiE
MSTKRVDYDQIAPDYDRRFKSDSSSGVGDALLNHARILNAVSILEVGCGTCHWLAQMDQANACLCGLDPSKGMLSEAKKRKARMELIQGYAQHLPFESNLFDFVFCVNALHHFGDPRAFISESARVLRPGGALAIVGMDPHGQKDSWYVYKFFTGVYEYDLLRLCTWEIIMNWMIAQGFKRIGLQQVERITELKQGREILDAPFLRKNSCSQLALLTDEEYETGLQRIEEALTLAEAQGETIVFQSDISLEMLIGYRELAIQPAAL